MNQDIESILKIRYSGVFESKLLNEIVQLGKIRTCHTGEELISYGSYITFLPLLINGSLRVLREDGQGNELFMYYLNSGETCAMSLTCCLNQRQSMVKAICEEETIFIPVPIERVEHWMKEYSSWKQFVMLTYQKRFEELINTIDSIAFAKMDDRIIDYLRKKTENLKNYDLQITHQEIADELNTSREVVSRLLKHLERDGKIKLSRNRIMIQSAL
ncbi:MAG: Crp/Fnr family transcriptional regulator [Calditrichaeota bacterium]|nr:Crp/Fnr family transcriptional regulator [Calditrichota bacterium]